MFPLVKDLNTQVFSKEGAMRSQTDYIVTKHDTYRLAELWLGKALKFDYEGTKCDGRKLLQVLLVAAARVASIYATCRDLVDGPTDQTIRNAMAATLPELPELERRLNRALATDLPKALFRKARMIAIDLTLIPYHGQPARDAKEIYRSAPKSGTTHFHAYATAVVIDQGHRYTLALTRVEYGESMKEVVKRLVRIVRSRGVKIKFLLLDKGFFCVEVIRYLKRAGYGFVIPAFARGRKPKPPKRLTGLRAMKKWKNGYYEHTLTGTVDGQSRSVQVTICVASKGYRCKKTDRRKTKKMLHAIWKVRLTPKEIREIYRKRFGIETSYRQMNEARIRTCTRDPAQRLLFIGVALVLRNVWVWLHFQFAKNKWSSQLKLFPRLLRFREMLHWIEQVASSMLGPDHSQGIELAHYKQLTAYG